MDDRRIFWHHPELDCVRAILPPDVLAAVGRRARDVGIGGGRVLVLCGLLSEEDYLRAVARQFGLPFDGLDAVARPDCPASDAQLVDAFLAGMLVFREGGRLVTAMVPRALTSRRRRENLRRSAHYPHGLRITSDRHLSGFLLRHAGAGIAERAVHALARRRPAFSAVQTRRSAVRAIIAASAVLAIGIAFAPRIANAVVGAALAVIFLAWSGLRLWSAVVAPDLRAAPSRCRDSDLPTYTIIVALHDEANVVDRLVAALDRLDYPPEKLDIKFVLEEDDAATHAAVAALNLRSPYQVLCAPREGPRTKPKALNTALLFALGRYTAVYDAEDEPEPDQLRKAVDCFRWRGPGLACVQARLTIDNARVNCLTRLFAAEYAGLFDVFLPGLARYRLPLPLGGSSNHFETAALREVGGWDPYNVTEDADLGMRLARFGYHATVIASSTREEAPPTFPLWFRQRTRWFKGWMQTWLVHMRTPENLWRDLGAGGFLVFQLVVGGTVLAALVHPVFFGVIVAQVTTQVARGEFDGPAALISPYGLACLAGYLAYAVLGVVGLLRRGLFVQAWVLVLTPIYWLLLSAAAWRAVYQLVRDPFRWEKTAHGIGRTSQQT